MNHPAPAIAGPPSRCVSGLERRGAVYFSKIISIYYKMQNKKKEGFCGNLQFDLQHLREISYK